MFKPYATYQLLAILLIVVASLQTASNAQAQEWSIPLAGNAFSTTAGKKLKIGRDGVLTLQPNDRCWVYFRIDQTAKLQFALRGQTEEGKEPAASVVGKLGEQQFEATVTAELATVKFEPASEHEIDAGYARLELRLGKDAKTSVGLTHLVVSSKAKTLKLNFVRNNEGNMFYWGRRGPSVHLRYKVPPGKGFRYAYSEITVPKGMDPIGSYFMANGFAEGYFGIQVNSDKERRVLFSVWSPFKTDNPNDVPQDQQVEMLACGKKVHVKKFGNEGTGGQSYLIYPWKAGKTYRFLTEVVPDGQGKTTYTSWFGDKAAGEWQLIASFRRPKTDKNLTGFHSFLENFSPTYGNFQRRANFGNVWVRDLQETWQECTRARLSVDATGRGQHRLDFDGGSDGKNFFMRNCGFFNETGNTGEEFTRESTESQRPNIDFEKLPRK